MCVKTDSFVVESNVHFPTDYNLLWDCSRKALEVIDWFKKKYSELEGWRKSYDWFKQGDNARVLSLESGLNQMTFDDRTTTLSVHCTRN